MHDMNEWKHLSKSQSSSSVSICAIIYPVYIQLNCLCLFSTVMSLLHAASMCCLVATASLLRAPSQADVTQDIANVLLGELHAECLMTDNTATQQSQT
jgi:branched-subunit amino acid permease